MHHRYLLLYTCFAVMCIYFTEQYMYIQCIRVYTIYEKCSTDIFTIIHVFCSYVYLLYRVIFV